MMISSSSRWTLLALSLSFAAASVCSRSLHRLARALTRRRPLSMRTPPRTAAELAAAQLPLIGDGTAHRPRVAADDARASLLLRHWRADADILAALARGESIRTEPLVYADEAGAPLYGQLVWADDGTSRRRAGVLLVHTAVGPRDLFLLWKAEALASLGLAVLLVDMFGDARGDAWDKEWAAPRRAAYQADPSLFARRMRLAHAALAASPLVDGSRCAALGFCFGGPPVLHYARANPDGLLAAITFHGILDAHPPPPTAHGRAPRARFLLCHAKGDPFIPASAFDACVAQLEALGARWTTLVFGGEARHSFTNPAQALNPDAAFAYDAMAARTSWLAAKDLLRETLLE
ncbi:hypothetical protein AB1Y20_011717 [Prymnesium parvum]|uniref:Dienelactone hydrolase domain-containing protein n=1 Tax=Prymnesium parvum TaxID=97485 RepID=A0AB34IJA5_PRYPA